jgi:chromosomal replication initiator protein
MRSAGGGSQTLQQPVPEDVDALWELVRGDLRASLPDSTFKLWLEPLRAVSAQGTTLYLAAPETVRAWVERRYERSINDCLRGAGTSDFKQRHREADVLLVDDVQFLEQKRQTEEEFFHTFNALHEAGSQIVLSSDRPPADLSRIAERLRDRFEWGLCAEIGPPDLRTRTTLLTRLARRNAPAAVDPEVLKEIASRVPANVRKLEGALNRVVAYASMMDVALDRELVRDVLEPHGGASEEPPSQEGLTLERIQDAVCAVMHLSSDDLLGRKRSAQAVRGRQLAIHLARERLGLSLGELGHAFDRDRATILHSLRAVERDLVPDSNTSATLERVQRRLEAVGV